MEWTDLREYLFCNKFIENKNEVDTQPNCCNMRKGHFHAIDWTVLIIFQNYNQYSACLNIEMQAPVNKKCT